MKHIQTLKAFLLLLVYGIMIMTFMYSTSQKFGEVLHSKTKLTIEDLCYNIRRNINPVQTPVSQRHRCQEYTKVIQPETVTYKRMFKNVSQTQMKDKDCVGYYHYSHVNLTVIGHFINMCGERGNDDVTLYTQLMPNRIENLVKICERWPGPMSVVLFIVSTNLKSLKEIIETLELHKRQNMILTVVTVDKPYEEPGVQFPVNTLRNIALNATRTKHVMYLDADFIPSKGTYNNIMKRLYGDNRTNDNHTMFIIPALETMETNLTFPDTKKEITELMNNGTIVGFHSKGFKAAHGDTRLDKWINSTSAYKIHVTNDRFEPYFIIRRDQVPWFPDEFVGRNSDKVAHCFILKKLGFTHIVLPDVYILHLPHPKTAQSTIEAKNNHRCAEKLYKWFRKNNNWRPLK